MRPTTQQPFMSADPSRVTAVVCTRDCEASIEACLRSLRDNGVGEIIVVDASSSDQTREIAGLFADEVLTDRGMGLGTARNLGIRRATLDFILNCGPDNVMPPGSIRGLLEAKETGGWAGVSAMTLVEGRGYASWASRRYKIARFTPGERSVIGTPTLFDTAMIQRHPFDDRATYSDDAELCERWTSVFGARFAIADVVAHEIGQNEIPSLITRFVSYGRSDHETFRRSRDSWSRRRRMRSVLHPLRVDFLEPFARMPFPADFVAVPFLAFITFTRYASWLREAWTDRAR